MNFRSATPDLRRLLPWLLIASWSCWSQPKTLTILHTNDMHAGMLPHEAFWVRTSPKPLVGGFKELWFTVDSIRHAKNDVLLLDAGDVMTGTPVAEMEYQGAVGGALFAMMNRIGYDAWTIGNHDLDISQENLRKLTAIAAFPTLSANLTDSLGRFTLNNRPYVVFHKNGVTIGVVGLILKELNEVTNTSNLVGLVVQPPVETMQRYVDSLRAACDLIIALTHEGVEEDSILAVSSHGLNVIIGGHSHTRLRDPKVVNGVLICQTGSNCENLGELDLTVENHAVTAFKGTLHSLWVRTDRREDDVSRMVDGFRGEVEKEYGQVVGSIGTDWRRSRNGESNIGDFVADAIREGSGADVGITNSSGIRKDLPAGKVTKLDLFEIAPFRNYLCTFTLSGRDLRALLQRYVESLAQGKTSIELSGVRCTWKKSGPGALLSSVMVGDRPLDDAASYRCGTIDFVINQGERYLGIVPPKVEYSRTLLYDAMVQKLQRDKSLPATLEGRIKESN